MATFQSIVITVATFILVVMLIVIGVSLNNAKSTQTWPPVLSECPDYWVDIYGKGKGCQNVQDLGKCTAQNQVDGHQVMDFSQAQYIGAGGSCAKYTWAKNCGITWDGITSGVRNPCINATA